MKKTAIKTNNRNNSWSKMIDLLKPYAWWIVLLIVLALLSNALNLIVPKIIAEAIDDFTAGVFDMRQTGWYFGITAIGVFVLFYLQSIVQTIASERVARDLRQKLIERISYQNFAFIQEKTTARLLTNLTADIDSIKMFVGQAIVSIVSSLFVILGVSAILIYMNWRLALAVLAVVPIIGLTFAVIFGRIKTLFTKAREILDRLNQTINESILGASLIRVLNSQQTEYYKFLSANLEAKNLGMEILKLFATMIPIISLVANLTILIILALGGKLVISDQLSLGDFTAFMNYVSILIFPIIIIGFMSNLIAQATASYERIDEILNQPVPCENGNNNNRLRGDLRLEQVSKIYGSKTVLKKVTIDFPAGSKTAIIGPTAAGKTQLVYLLIGLIKPDFGKILFDGIDVSEYEQNSLHRQIGLVFQDSVLFNLSLRENISFGDTIDDDAMIKAIQTAELDEFIDSLPDKMETIISERGTSLSGGQKQRIMLARALALNPKILLLDDFTARVDNQTEQKILQNIQKNYPHITLISVTQKISTIEHYDQIVLLMEGEMIASGRHEQLLSTCPEYAQIYQSQQSTSSYELRS